MTTQLSPTAVVAPVYVVRVSSAKMPNSCWGHCYHVAVLECDPGTVPYEIGTRQRGVRRIISCERRLFGGKSGRCAEARATARARDLATRLNSQAARKLAELVDHLYAQSVADRSDEI